MLKEPLSPEAATLLIKRIARDFSVAWTQHADKERQADSLNIVDCVNVLRCGAVTEPADFIRETWRYRIHTNRIGVVVAFRSETELAIVTVWRKRE